MQTSSWVLFFIIRTSCPSRTTFAAPGAPGHERERATPTASGHTFWRIDWTSFDETGKTAYHQTASFNGRWLAAVGGASGAENTSFPSTRTAGSASGEAGQRAAPDSQPSCCQRTSKAQRQEQANFQAGLGRGRRGSPMGTEATGPARNGDYPLPS
jgi:hypothetical protein